MAWNSTLAPPPAPVSVVIESRLPTNANASRGRRTSCQRRCRIARYTSHIPCPKLRNVLAPGLGSPPIHPFRWRSRKPSTTREHLAVEAHSTCGALRGLAGDSALLPPQALPARFHEGKGFSGHLGVHPLADGQFPNTIIDNAAPCYPRTFAARSSEGGGVSRRNINPPCCKAPRIRSTAAATILTDIRQRVSREASSNSPGLTTRASSLA